MGGGDNAAQRASDAALRTEASGDRIEERCRRRAERRARRRSEQARRRLEDAELLGHLVQQRVERGTLEAAAAEMPRTLNRGYGFSQPVQVAPALGAGRFGVVNEPAKVETTPPLAIFKRPI